VTAVALRPYQLEQVAAVERHQLLHKQQRVMYLAATGTGKSVSATEVIRRAVATRGETGLFLAHRRELIDQMVGHLTRAGLVVGVERGSRRAGAEPVVCASVQTMRGERLEKFPRDAFDVVVVDECHHAASPSYCAIFAHFKDARVVGVTATGDRADGRPLGAVFSQVVHRIEIDQAIEAGYLTPVRGIQVTVPGMDLSKVRSRKQCRAGGEDVVGDPNSTIDLLAPSGQARIETGAGGRPERVSVDLHPKDLARVVLDPVVVDGVVGPLLELAGARKTIVFAVDRAHAAAIADAINARRPGPDGKGVARWLWHKTPDRKQVQLDHKAGKFQFLVNVLLLTEGYDDPSIECVAMARPTQSRVLYCQCVGRALRLFEGKVEALLLDFVGVGGKFDLVGPEDVLGTALVGLEQYGEKREMPAGDSKKVDRITVGDLELAPWSAAPPTTPSASPTSSEAPQVVSFTTRVVQLVRGWFRRKK